MYYYGFNEQGVCQFSADGPVIAPEGMVVVEAEAYHDISTIQLKDGNIVAREEDAARKQVFFDSAKRQLLADAGGVIDSIRDAMEFSDYDGGNELDAWRKYRGVLYALTFEQYLESGFPPKP